MKVFAAATVSNSGDHELFVSLTKDGITDQIIEMARWEYGDESENQYWQDNAKYNEAEYGNDYNQYLLEQYMIDEREFDV